MTNKIILELEESVINYETELAKELAIKAIDEKVDLIECASALIKGIRKIGERYKNGELFLPSLIGASNVIQVAMPIITEEIKKQGKKTNIIGKVVIGTVFGDVHNIGKTMVATLLVAEGFEVIDLGVNVRGNDFIEAIKKHKADILAMSALLTTTMLEQRNVIEALKRENIRDKVKIMVGGAPITQDFANEIGADGYDPTAVGAVRLAREMLNKNYKEV